MRQALLIIPAVLMLSGAYANAEQVQAILVDGCTTGTAYKDTCSVNIPWPAPFINTNYLVNCTVTGFSTPANAVAAFYDLQIPFASHTTTNSTIIIRNLYDYVGVTIPQIQCIGVLP